MRRLFPASLLLIVTCNGGEPEPVANGQTQGVVDSIFPVVEEIRRFKFQVGGPFPTELEHAAESRDQLVLGFIAALETRDTTTMRSLAVTSREFIELYYPHSPYARPPYKQSPALLWFLMQQNSQKGFSRALDRYGGTPAGFRGIDCQPEPRSQERNRLWDCAVRWTPGPGKPDRMKLFGTIIEREGRFKFLTYANDL
ncbi:MAG: hypothetical protein ACREMA_00505 [Longimicrobiales bacterium]